LSKIQPGSFARLSVAAVYSGDRYAEGRAGGTHPEADVGGRGLPLPTVRRLTTVLAERGYLERNPDTRRFWRSG
jgi:hypothetical protein